MSAFGGKADTALCGAHVAFLALTRLTECAKMSWPSLSGAALFA